MDHAVHERTPRNESFPNCCHHVVIQDCKPLTTPKRLPLRYGVSPMTVDAETIKWGDCLDAVSRTTPQPVVKRFTQSSGTENNIEERNDDGRDDMDRPAAQGALREEPQGDGAAPGGASGTAQQVGGAVQGVHRSSLHGIQNMRINWLMDNHPQQFREMMMANVLEEHLRDIERRTRERQAQIVDRLMESRHLLNRTDCLKAAPQMTDLDRLNGMNEAQAESMSMAIHEIVESILNANADVHLGSVPKRLCLIVPVFQSLRLFPR